jgi:hypothetical protein
MKLTTPLYCAGQQTHAWFNAVLGKWVCARCGKDVRVVT